MIHLTGFTNTYKHHIVFLITLIVIYRPAISGQVSITSGDLPGIQIMRNDYIEGKALWGLIDGGADIYFEYGFSDVTVQEILWEKHRIKVEIYRMLSEKAAFGIFSVSHLKCKPDTLAVWCCTTPHQVQIATGNYYITIVNDSGTPSAQQLTRKISQKVLEKVHGKGLTLPSLFMHALYRQYNYNIKYISGPLGLQTGYPSWDENFISIENYNAYILPIESDSGSVTISVITFNKSEDIKRYLYNLNPSATTSGESWSDEKDGTTRYFRSINQTNIIYLEADIPAILLKNYIQVIESTK